jgi:hypothetical protein
MGLAKKREEETDRRVQVTYNYFRKRAWNKSASTSQLSRPLHTFVDIYSPNEAKYVLP